MDSRYHVYAAPQLPAKPSGVARPRIWDAQRVRALRQFLRLTQEEFSQRLGTRQQNVSEWERGKHRPRGMSIIMLEKLADEAGFESVRSNSPSTAGPLTRRDVR
jgi:DNA-binding XRE family transcriptional regulator